MKLLYISPSPPNEMERVRSLNILKSLKKENVEITLITLYNKKQEKYLDIAKKYTNEIIKIKYNRIISAIYVGISIFLPIPARVGYCFNFKLKKFLKKHNEKYDIAYIKRLRMAQYKQYINADKIYIDITDSLTKYYERLCEKTKNIKKLFYLEEYHKLRKYEIKVCENNKNIVICSEYDKKYIENISKKASNNIQVIENVVELEKWKQGKIEVNKIGNRKQLVFLGIMDYEPNILAVKYIIEKIMPKLDPKYTLKIIGPKVPKNLKALESERIKFLGYVEDVKKELQKADIFICPIFVGSGVKNKILQAGMVGLPIICTDFSIEGINENIKKVIYRANNEEEFIRKIKEIQDIKEEQLISKLEEQKNIIEKYNSIEIISRKILSNN